MNEQLPQENQGRIPPLFVLMIGIMIGWGATYFYFEAGSFRSQKDLSMPMQMPTPKTESETTE
ncbi:MAG: hypothetical protein OXT67_02150 [Zetaproteobacteria bacterium]|nr:hypothetical protein [Zetaproteobacteria bacterium]